MSEEALQRARRARQEGRLEGFIDGNEFERLVKKIKREAEKAEDILEFIYLHNGEVLAEAGNQIEDAVSSAIDYYKEAQKILKSYIEEGVRTSENFDNFIRHHQTARLDEAFDIFITSHQELYEEYLKRTAWKSAS